MATVKRQTIFCVDDDKKNLELLEALLSLQGYALKFFESGEDALAQIKKETPDLILLDIMMPGLSGFEVVERLRSDERTRFIPIILVTALRSERDKIEGIDAGCDDFISKPFDLIELRARVRSLMRISCFRKALEEKEKLCHVIYEMSQPLVVCGPDWVITNFNHAAQEHLTPGASLENQNFLDLIYKNYSVPSDRKELDDCRKAQKKIEITRKDPGQFGGQRLEISLEVLKNPAHEVTNIVLMLRNITQG